MNIGLSPYKNTALAFSGKKLIPAKIVPQLLSSNRVCNALDIKSNAEYPLNILSNFTKSRFVLDGVQINSMEGFLQSLKIPDIEEQKEICSLIGFSAKKTGNRTALKNGFNGKFVYWQGKKIDRFSSEYQDLLERAFLSKYNADCDFRCALAYTQGKALSHTIGKQNPCETILTEKEFVRLLMKLRDCDIKNAKFFTYA